MKTNRILITITAAALLITAACDKIGTRVKGNGDVVTETRSVGTFRNIDNEGEFDVYIIQDSIYEVKIEAESNLISHIRTKIDGSTLEIDTRDNLKPTHPMKLIIRTPEVRGVRLSGSGIIDVREIDADLFDITLSGSGDITGDILANECTISINGSGNASVYVSCNTIETNISGSGEMYIIGNADIAYFNISGSGSMSAYDFPVKDCYTDISGSGNMRVNVSDYLYAKISGSGSVYYIGYPEVTTDISGSGNIVSMN